MTDEKAGGVPPALKIGGDEGDRTLDLGIANAALSQLSYVPQRRKIIAGRRIGRKQGSPIAIGLRRCARSATCGQTKLASLKSKPIAKKHRCET